MSKIAPDIISYEHIVPLQGLDAMKGTFRWEVPNLHVLVRGDIAVTWGLNRVQAQMRGGVEYLSWSRGTRVFQKIEGAWKMIHQHVSDPYDPETGQAKIDLTP